MERYDLVHSEQRMDNNKINLQEELLCSMAMCMYNNPGRKGSQTGWKTLHNDKLVTIILQHVKPEERHQFLLQASLVWTTGWLGKPLLIISVFSCSLVLEPKICPMNTY